MRIISKFHDYYDAAQAGGQDRSLVFVREQTEYPRCREIESLPSALKAFIDLSVAMTPGALTLDKASKAWTRSDVYFGLVLFAGRLYPFAQVHRKARGAMWASDAQFIYALEELDVMLTEHGYDLAERDKEREKHSTRGRNGPASIRVFFGLCGDDRLHGHATENSLAALSYMRHRDLLTVNPRLADINFYRQLATAQAYQELSMFLGNIAAPDRAPVTIADKDRVAQHGFDKWSFRKLPSH